MFEEMEEAQAACQLLYDRIGTVCGGLSGFRTDDKSPSGDVVERSNSLLNKFEAFVSSYMGKALHARVIAHEKLVNELRGLHEAVDDIVRDMADPYEFASGERFSEVARSEQAAALNAIVSDIEAVRRHIKDESVRIEAMTILQHEINHQQDRGHSVDAVKMMRRLVQTLDSILGCSDTPTLQRSFLTPVDGPGHTTKDGQPNVETKSVAELVQLLVAESIAMQESATRSLYRLARDSTTCHSIKNAGGYRALVRSVQNATSTLIQKLYAFGCLHRINSYEECDELLGMSGIKSTLATLSNGYDVGKLATTISRSTSDEAVTEAVELVACLAWIGTESQNKLQEAEVLPRLVEILQSGTDKQVVAGLIALRALATGNESVQVALSKIGAIPVLVSQLTIGNDEQIIHATHVLAEMASSRDSIRLEIAAAGAMKRLVMLVRDGNDEQKEVAAKALAVCGINDDIAVATVKAGGIVALVELLCQGNLSQKTHAVSALSSVARLSNSQAVITRAGGINPLVGLLYVGTETQKRHALRVICHLTSHSPSLSQLVNAGVVDPLVDLLRVGSDEEKEQAALSLARLASDDEARVAVMSSSATEPLIALLQDGNQAQAKHALDAFLLLGAGGNNVYELLNAGAIKPLVNVVLTGSSDRVKVATEALRVIVRAFENASVVDPSPCILPLVELLRQGNGDGKELAIKVLASLAATNRDTQRAIIQANGIDPIVQLLHESDSLRVQALDTLSAFASDADNRIGLAQAGAIEPLCDLLNNEDDDARISAATLLGKLALDCRNHVVVVNAVGHAPMLELLRCGSDEQCKVAAFVAKMTEVSWRDRQAARESVDIEVLTDLGYEGGTELRRYVARQLSNLAGEMATRIQLANKKTIQLLVTVIKDTDPTGQKVAMHALMLLTIYNPTVVAETKGVIDLITNTLRVKVCDLKDDALRALINLCDVRAGRLVSAGVIVLLIDLVQNGNDMEKELSISAIGKLGAEDEIASFIADAGAIGALSDMMTTGSERLRTEAKAALIILSGHTSVTSALKRFIAPLVANLEGDGPHKASAAQSCFNLCAVFNIRPLLAEAGAIVPLIHRLRSDDDASSMHADEAFEDIESQVDTGQHVADSGACAALVDLVMTGTDCQKVYATQVLDSLASDQLRTTLVSAIAPLVVDVRTGSGAAREKAVSALANVSHFFAGTESSLGARLIDEAGAVESLADLLKSKDQRLKELAAHTLAFMPSDSNEQVLVAKAAAIDMLISLLETGSDLQRKKTMRTITGLDLDNLRELLAPVISPLIDDVQSSDDGRKERAIQVLSSLWEYDEIQDVINDADIIMPLISHLKKEGSKSVELMEPILSNFALNHEVYSSIMSADGISVLINLIKSGNERQMDVASRVLARLTSYSEACESMMVAGAIGPLVHLLKVANCAHKTAAAEALGNLSAQPNAPLLIAEAGGIGPLVDLLKGEDNEQKNYATRSLANLSEDEDVGPQVLNADAAPVLIELLLTSVNTETIENCRRVLRADGNTTGRDALQNVVFQLLVYLKSGTVTEKECGVRVLEVLSSDAEVQTWIVEAGAVARLVDLHMTEPALFALGALDSLAQANSGRIELENVVSPLVEKLQSGESDHKADAIRALAKLSDSSVIRAIIATVGTLTQLVDVLRRSHETAAASLVSLLEVLTYDIAFDESVGYDIADASDVCPLVELLKIGNDTHKANVAGALASLSCTDQAAAQIADAGGIPLLVGLLSNDNDTQRANAAIALINFAYTESGDKSPHLDSIGFTSVAQAAVVALRECDIQSSVFNLIRLLCDDATACCALDAAGVIDALSELDESPEAQTLVSKIREHSRAPSDYLAERLVNQLLAADASDATDTLCSILTFVEQEQDEEGRCVLPEWINVIAEYVASDSDRDRELAMQILLGIRTKNPAASEAIARSGVIKPLAQLIDRGTDSQQSLALTLLLNIVMSPDDDGTRYWQVKDAVNWPSLIEMSLLESHTGECAKKLLLILSTDDEDKLSVLQLLFKEAQTGSSTVQGICKDALRRLSRGGRVSPAVVPHHALVLLLNEGTNHVQLDVINLLARVSPSHADAFEDTDGVSSLLRLADHEHQPLKVAVNKLLSDWASSTHLINWLSFEQVMPLGQSGAWTRRAICQSLTESSPPVHKFACGLAQLSFIDVERLEVTDHVTKAWASLANMSNGVVTSSPPSAVVALIVCLAGKARSDMVAACALCELACIDVYPTMISNAGGIPAIVGLLFANAFLYEATLALAALAKASVGARLAILEAGAIGPLIELATTNDNESIRVSAASALTGLASNRHALQVIHLLGGLDAVAVLARKGNVQERIAARSILRPLCCPLKIDEGA